MFEVMFSFVCCLTVVLQMNGNDIQSGTPSHKALHDYKLLVDPFLVKGGTKLYRHDGVVPGDYPPVTLKDPRNVKALRLRTRLEPIELPVPRYFRSYSTTNYSAGD